MGELFSIYSAVDVSGEIYLLDSVADGHRQFTGLLWRRCFRLYVNIYERIRLGLQCSAAIKLF